MRFFYSHCHGGGLVQAKLPPLQCCISTYESSQVSWQRCGRVRFALYFFLFMPSALICTRYSDNVFMDAVVLYPPLRLCIIYLRVTGLSIVSLFAMLFCSTIAVAVGKCYLSFVTSSASASTSFLDHFFPVALQVLLLMKWVLVESCAVGSSKSTVCDQFCTNFSLVFASQDPVLRVCLWVHCWCWATCRNVFSLMAKESRAGLSLKALAAGSCSRLLSFPLLCFILGVFSATNAPPKRRSSPLGRNLYVYATVAIATWQAEAGPWTWWL